MGQGRALPFRYAEIVKVSRISKIAGFSLVGFAVGAVAANKVNVGPLISQAAGFAGAFIGTLVARRKAPGERPPNQKDEPPQA